jgi:hypothetical protein
VIDTPSSPAMRFIVVVAAIAVSVNGGFTAKVH